ncbi:MAG: hypothetical protein ACE5HD_05780 [Acidobacteriota bacterium]
MPGNEPERDIERLVFVYEGKSGFLSATVDTVRKVLMIRGCALCGITHGLAGEKAEWKACRKEIGLPIEYLHQDEVSGEVRSATGDAFPCVLARVNGKLEMLLTPEALLRCRGNIDDLRGRLKAHATMKGLRLPY